LWAVPPAGWSAYEVRLYCLEAGPMFARPLRGVPVRAAHCLTSIQFSPTSEHLLLAFGRRARPAPPTAARRV